MKKKVICGVIALVMAATGALVVATNKTARADEAKSPATISSGDNHSLATTLMDETVYVFLDADGKVKKTISSDWTKNDLGTDVYTKTEGKVSTPVTVGVTYYLDGKKVSAEEIRGRSGHFKIRYNYINNEVVNGMYMPYAVLSGVVLPNDHFANVVVKNGKLINDGARLVIVGVALPGMQANLGVGIELPEYVEIEGDAKDFKMEMTATIATAQIFADVDTSGLNSVAALSSQLDTLASSMLQLMNGSVQLRDGLATLNNKSSLLVDGVSQLKLGSAKLAAGAKSLSDGLSNAYNGSKALSDELSSAYNQSKPLVSGVSTLYNGAKELEAGINQLTDSLGAMVNGISGLNSKGAELATGATALMNGTLSSLNGRLAEYLTMYDLPQLTADNFEEILKQIIEAMPADTADDPGMATELTTALNNLKIYKGVISCTAALSQLASGAAAAPEKVTLLKNGASGLANGLSTVNKNVPGLVDGLGKLSGGASDLYNGLSSAYNGSKDLATGMASLDAGISNLISNMPALTDGVNKLYSGANSLTEGLSQFNDQGVQKLVALFNGNIKALIDRIQAIVNLAKKSAKIKYIYRTEEI